MEEAHIYTALVLMCAMFGACMGSFLNVVAHRSIENRPWWGRERSVCETCGHVLTARELVPIVSWISQRGRCRNCGSLISPRYVIVEIICALTAGLCAWRWGLSPALAVSMICSFGLLLNSLTDFESGDVFDLFALLPGGICLLLRMLGGRDAVIDGMLGAAAGWGIFAAIIIATKVLLSKEGMGWGDAVFMCGAGAALGWKLTLLAFYLGMMAGGIWIIVLMILGRVRIGRGDTVPLVPYLAAGCFISLIWGSQILNFIGTRLGSPAGFPADWPF